MDYPFIDYHDFINRASSSEDVLFDEDRTTLIKYSIGKKGDYAISDTVDQYSSPEKPKFRWKFIHYGTP